jgi:hypothetical protein
MGGTVEWKAAGWRMAYREGRAMKVLIYSNTGIVEFPVTHVGISIDGTVQLMGDVGDGEPFTVEIQGRDFSGRDFAEALKVVNRNMIHAYKKMVDR